MFGPGQPYRLGRAFTVSNSFSDWLQLIEDHMTLMDTKRYMLGVLKKYSSLQTFKPEMLPWIKCYTGQQLLSQFKFLGDMQVILRAYPWLDAVQKQC